MDRSHGHRTLGRPSFPSPRIRRLVALASLVVLGSAGAACDGSEPTATSSSTSTATDPTVTDPAATTDPSLAPVSGGDLVVGIDAESPGYHPHLTPWGNGGHIVARAVFDPLAALDSAGLVRPYLAESIEPNDDATVWTIRLRDGVRFHNGEVLDAEAVRLNFTAVLNSPVYSSQLQLLASMAVVDALTLELTMSAPWTTFPHALTGDIGRQIGYMAAPAMLADPQGSSAPIGTGPFAFVEWLPDDRLTVERFDGYWRSPAWLDTVTFRPIPDAAGRAAALEAGDIDVLYTDNASEIGAYLQKEAAGEATVEVGAPTSATAVMLNTRAAPLDDIRVRRALAMAVDLDRLYAELGVTGVYQPLSGPYPTDSFWFAESSYPEFDPTGAAALIDEYVAETGAEIELELAGNDDPSAAEYLERLQDAWAGVGIAVDVATRPQGDNIAAVVAGDYQMIVWRGIGVGDPDSDYDDFRSGTGLNFSGFSTSEMDAALDIGRRLSDPEARRQQYAIVQRILGDNVPFIWIGTSQFAVVTRPKVVGVGDFALPDGTAGQPVTGGRFFLKDVWLQQ